MSDDREALAHAVARIEALTAELAQATAALARANTAMAAVQRSLADEAAQRAEAERVSRELRQQSEAARVAHALELKTVQAETVKAKAERDAVGAKWNELYGPVEEGIARGPQPLVTPHDNRTHATLADAPVHSFSYYCGSRPPADFAASSFSISGR